MGRGGFPLWHGATGAYTYDRTPGKVGAACAALRDAQTATLSVVPNTGMAVTMDVGNPKDIHPKNKQAVGDRLALWALAKVYGRDVVYSGPTLRSLSIEGERSASPWTTPMD